MASTFEHLSCKRTNTHADTKQQQRSTPVSSCDFLALHLRLKTRSAQTRKNRKATSLPVEFRVMASTYRYVRYNHDKSWGVANKEALHDRYTRVARMRARGTLVRSLNGLDKSKRRRQSLFVQKRGGASKTAQTLSTQQPPNRPIIR